jgi:hypothetical protein
VDIAQAKLRQPPVLVAMIHITISFDSEILPGATSSQSAYTGPLTMECRSDSVKLANLYGLVWAGTGNIIDISHEPAVGVACKILRMNSSGRKWTRVVWQDW